MLNSRSLDDLHPSVKLLCEAFLAKCRDAGIDIIITSTYRDLESQSAIYAQGRTAPGNKITNAKPGQSFHNYRCAFDFVPIVSGKAQWNDSKLFKQCGVIAEEVGLTWAGRWKSFPEMAHCQYTAGLTLADFQAGKTLENVA